MSFVRSLLLTAMVSILLGGAGVWVGSRFLGGDDRASSPHELLHRRLHLTASQEEQIAQMEAQHTARRQLLEAEMRAANADLAKALFAQHAYTSDVSAAVERFHHAMGQLQKETIEHMLAMRAVLTPEQASRFDQTIVQSLTEPAQ